ncbi:hypothetical protein DPEC_G00022980 [Dallia pectoralis]|uniref:Uncharacterized protein n=1 Tax=Dallia pectoralis TaxID=75939 RepID=A0ACC2HHA1_DALPE|nr:hypothetical protein DPEC_G00022980 [Dallia pectoralis]
MAMLRVSSYRRQFDQWSRNQGCSCGGPCCSEVKVKARDLSAEECACDELDFVTAKALNKEGLVQFAKDRSVIAALNDRFVALINMARCFEEDNYSLEAQICELEERLATRQSTASISTAALPEYSLDAVVDRLRKERDQSLFDVEELRKELACLQEKYEETLQRRTLIQLEREDVRLVVDAVTTDCLALREQVKIYEAQLTHNKAQHDTMIQSMLAPADGPAAAGRDVLDFCSPDIVPLIMDVKENYDRLAETIQIRLHRFARSVAPRPNRTSLSKISWRGSAGVNLALREVGAGGTWAVVADEAVKDQDSAGSTSVGKIKDIDELKKLIGELQKELSELEACNELLEEEIEMKREAHLEEIAELECRIEEIQVQQQDLQVQMGEQCDDYQELFSQKMVREVEIAVYRSLVEEEDERLCYL